MAMAKIKDLVTVSLQLADTLCKLAREAGSYRSECAEVNAKAEKLTKLLGAVVRLDGAGGPLYTRPLRRMLQDLEKSLGKALILVRKCNRNGVIKRVITITTAHDFKRVSILLENSIADLTWFLNISAIGENRAEGVGGMAPIASNEPLLGYCWENIALLHRGTEEEREDATLSLRAYAKNNERFTKLMVEEEAIVPLLKVLQDGTLNAREAAARSLGDMARDADVVKQMIEHGVASVFVKVLNSAPMKVQAAVAWAMAEMLDVGPEQKDVFLEQAVVRPLVGLLGEFLEETAKADESPITMQSLMSRMAANKGSVPMPSNIPAAAAAPGQGPRFHGEKPLKSSLRNVGRSTDAAAEQRNYGRQMQESGRGLTQRELNRRERENENPVLKTELKAEVARALWKLAKGNSNTCKSITETKALLCFATLMEKARGAVQLNSTMAVMEIAAVAEKDVDLRRAAFKTSTSAAKAVVDQLLRLVEEGNSELRVACIKAIGCLSRTFPARETRVVKPLVKQLESGSEDTASEAVTALIKFACEENFLHNEHSRAIVEASAAPHLVQLIYFGRGEVQVDAVKLMCYLAMHAGDSEALGEAEPLPALKGFAKNMNSNLHPLEKLLHQAISHLEIYHGRASRDVSDPYSHDYF